MSWIPLNTETKKVDTKDQPRYLTKEEINYITAHLPLTVAAVREVAENCRNGIVNDLTQRLMEREVCPSAIPEITAEIVRQHHASVIIPGSPVGITAAEALGSQNTQSTLNTFHHSGQSKSASQGIAAMRSIIFANLHPRGENCTVYFEDKTLTYEQVLESKSFIVGSVVSDFVSDYTIRRYLGDDDPWWYASYQAIFYPKVEVGYYRLRLQLNIVEMYRQKVTTYMLVDALRREKYNMPHLGIKNATVVIAFPSPNSEGLIDIFLESNFINGVINALGEAEQKKRQNKEKKRKINDERQSREDELSAKRKRKAAPVLSDIYLVTENFETIDSEILTMQNVIVKQFPFIRVKGVPGLKYLYPQIMYVAGLIQEERFLEERDLVEKPALRPYVADEESVWLVTAKKKIMRDSGMSTNHLVRLFQEAGIQVLVKMSERLCVKLPLYLDQLNALYRTDLLDLVYLKIDADNNITYYLELQDFEKDQSNYLRRLSDERLSKSTKGLSEKTGKNLSYQFAPDEIMERNGYYYHFLPAAEVVTFEVIAGIVKYYYPINPDNYVLQELKPSDYVKYQMGLNEEMVKNEIERRKEETGEEQFIVIKTELMRANEYIYALTDSASLQELMSLPEIDRIRTVSSNMFVISSILGIEATRAFLVRLLTNTLKASDAYINPANIQFIAEFMTNRGKVYGTTYNGISRQPGGHLSLATLSKAGIAFKQSSIFGKEEDIRNISASIVVGERITSGNGYFDVGLDQEMPTGEIETFLNEDIHTAHFYTPQKSKKVEKEEKEEKTSDLLQELDELPEVALAAPNQKITTEKEDFILPDNLVDVLNEIKIGNAAPAVQTLNIPSQRELNEQYVKPQVSEALIFEEPVFAQYRGPVPKVFSLPPRKEKPVRQEEVVITDLQEVPQILQDDDDELPELPTNLEKAEQPTEQKVEMLDATKLKRAFARK